MVLMSTAQVNTYERRADPGVGDRWRPRWRWTVPGLCAGILVVSVGMFLKESPTGVYLELVGFVVLLVTLVGFLVVGPGRVDDL